MRTRSRFAALTAIVGLLVGGAVLGSGVAANADSVVEITSPAGGSNQTWSSSTGYRTTFSGTTTDLTPSDTIRVLDYSSGGSPDSICDATNDGSGFWTCDAPLGSLAPGTYEVHAEQGSNSDIVFFNVAVPDAPTIDGLDPDTTTIRVAYGTSDLFFTGTAIYPGGIVHVDGGSGYPAACSSNVDSGSAWGNGTGNTCSISLDDMVPGTTYSFFARQENGGANGPNLDFDVYYGNPPPASVQITEPGSQSTYAPDPFVVSGVAPVAGGPVSVTLDGSPFCSDESIDPIEGGWSCNGPTAPRLPTPGSHTVEAVQGSDEPVDIVVNVLLPAPSPYYYDGSESFVPGETDATFSGQTMYSNASTRLNVYDAIDGAPGPTVRATTTCGDSDGFWTCDLDLSSLPEGDYYVVARHFVDDPDVGGAPDQERFSIRTPVYEGPIVNCVFSPGGGAQISSPEDISLEVWQIEQTGGEGFSLGYPGNCSGNAGVTFPGYDGGWVNPGDELGCDASCDLHLAPGLYELSYDSCGECGYDYLFRIPPAPAITTVLSTDASVLLRGTGVAGDRVRIMRSTGTSQLCSVTVTGAGTWACSFPKSSATSARALDIDAASGGISAYSASRAIPIATETVVITPENPALVKWLLEVDDLSNLKPGDHFSITVSGMPAGWTIDMVMHSDPYALGTFVATGEPMTMDLVVPEDIEGGAHTVEMVATTPLGTSYYETLDANVVTPGAAGDPTPAPTEEPGDGTPGHPTGGAGDRSDAGTPSALTGSLPTIAQILANPITIAFAGGIALALLLLVALPTELLNSSLESNSSRLGRGYSALDRALTRAQDWFIKVTRSRAIAAAVIVLVISIVYGFVDPHFGFDIVSLRLVLSLAIAFFLLSYVASWISGLIVRRAWGAEAVINMNPTIIIFAVVGVIVARILEFSPGFLIGIAIGLELLNASRKVAARSVLVQLGVIVALAGIAWVAYSLFTPGADFFGMLTEDTLVATTAEGLTGAMIAVFPLRFLEGFELWENSKRLWVAAFVIIGVAFALIVLPTAIEGSEVRDYGVWVIVFAVFGAISLLIWWIFARADKRDEAKEEHEKVDAE